MENGCAKKSQAAAPKTLKEYMGHIRNHILPALGTNDLMKIKSDIGNEETKGRKEKSSMKSH